MLGRGTRLSRRVAGTALAVAAVAGTIVLQGSVASAGAHATTVLKIIVIAGQSNAEGFESYAIPPGGVNLLGKQPADTSVPFAFRGDYVSNVDTPPTVLDDPQVLVATRRQTFGLEIGVARYLWAHQHTDIAIEKVVHSGSALTAWQIGRPLLTALSKQVADLVAYEQQHGTRASVAAIVWMQGESEALGSTAPLDYRASLRAFLPHLRGAVLGSTSTPVVVVQTNTAAYVRWLRAASHGQCVPASCANLLRWNSMVRAAQVAAAESSPNTYVVDSSGFPRTTFQLHLSATGELGLGAAIGRVLSPRL